VDQRTEQGQKALEQPLACRAYPTRASRFLARVPRTPMLRCHDLRPDWSKVS
jgi:hypothetical protein